MKISFAALSLPKTGALAVAVAKDRTLSDTAKQLDKASDGALARAMKVSRFRGKKGEILEVLAPPKVANSRILLYGTGDPGGARRSGLGGDRRQADRPPERVGESEAALLVEGGAGAGAEAAARAAYGALLQTYRFDRYLTKQEEDKKPSLTTLRVLVDGPAAARKHYKPLEQVAAGVFLTRDLVSEPANVIYPKSLVERAKGLKALGVKVQVLGEKEMAHLGMGALLGVGQGSACESQLLVLHWQGAKVGKEQAAARRGRQGG